MFLLSLCGPVQLERPFAQTRLQRAVSLAWTATCPFEMSSKVQVLILGGISDGTAFALLQYIDAHRSQEVSFVRLADKHLLIPSAKAYLTWLDAASKVMSV